MDAIFTPQTLLLCVMGLFFIGAVVLFIRYAVGGFRTVPDGHVSLVHRLGRHSRWVDNFYWLLPFESEAARIYVRQREASATLQNIFTDGGLSVIVNLRYAYRLDPKHMATDELYYSDADRKSQQEVLIREALLDLIEELKSPATAPSGSPPVGQRSEPAAEDMVRLDVVGLFSPFAGPKETVLRSRLKERVSAALLPHGVVVTSAPVQIAGLNLHPDISAAYREYVEAKFSGAARSEFIRRVRAAAPTMSEGGLVQLLNVIQNPTADIHTIFSTGTVNQDMLLRQSSRSVQKHIEDAPHPDRAADLPPKPPPTRPDKPQEPPTGGDAGDEPGADGDYPLVESDNALLKSTRGEMQEGARG